MTTAAEPQRGAPARPDPLRATREWVERAVLGLGLCPFAGPVRERGAIRYALSRARTEDELVADLERELKLLAGSDPAALETTLLVHPEVLGDFTRFNDFLDVAEALVEALGMEGVLQVASFHPDYRFEGTESDAIDNYTNRSPYPTLHLLREDSIARALDDWPDPDGIYRRNIETLRRLGHAGWRALWEPQMNGPVRRVVTGHDPAGRAIVLSDAAAPNVKIRQAAGGLVSTLAWATDESPADISGSTDRADREIGVAPPPRGSVFRVVDFPPLGAGGAGIDHDAVLREMGLGGAGGGAAGAERSPFMHRTRSIDYAIVIRGEIDMLLDDSEVHLQAGDLLVQQGTNHAWVNRSSAPCRIAFVLIDAAEPPAWSHR